MRQLIMFMIITHTKTVTVVRNTTSCAVFEGLSQGTTAITHVSYILSISILRHFAVCFVTVLSQYVGFFLSKKS